MASAEEFVISLQQRVDGPANAATQALNKLESQILREQAALGGLESKLGSAKDKLAQLQQGFGGKVDIAAVSKAREAVEALQSKVGEKGKGLATLESALPQMQAAKGEADSVGGKIRGMADAMQNANGVTGKLTAALKSLGPVGQAVAAILTVVIAVVGAVVIAMRDMMAAAISISQQKDALTATFAALAGGAKGADSVHASVAKLDAALPQSKGMIEDWATSLLSAGIEGAKLESGITAIASAAAMMPKTGAAAAEKMVKQLAEGGEAAKGLMKQIQEGGKKSAVLLADMGLQSKDLAAALGVTPEKFKAMTLTAEQMGNALEKALIGKGKGALETMGLSWDSIKGKLHDGMDSLFEDMGSAVRPFMAEVKSLFSEFFEGSLTMETSKSVIVAVLTEMFSVATRVVNFMHKGFLTIEIAAFKVVAALWPIISVIIAIGSNDTVLSAMGTALKGIGIAILVVVGAFAAMAAIITAVIGFFGLMVGAVLSAGAFIIGGFISIEDALFNSPAAVRSALAEWATAAVDGAVNFVSGIVNGITSGVGAVVAAVKGLASSAMGAFTGFFKIHSPSQLMADTAIHIPGGAVEGIEAGTGDVVDAMTDMGGAGMGGASKGFGKGAKGASAGGDVYNLNVAYSGKKEDEPDFIALLAAALEQARALSPRNA